MSVPEEEIEVTLHHKRALFGDITGKERGAEPRTGGTTVSAN